MAASMTMSRTNLPSDESVLPADRLRLGGRSCVLMLVLLAMLAALGTGCRKEVVEKDYARPLGDGARALIKLHPDEWPALTTAVRGGDRDLLAAMDNSISWFAKPSSRQFFPIEGITHEQAQASVIALRHLLTTSAYFGQFNAGFAENFDIYMSVGWNGQGEVLFTGYYSPVVHASRVRTSEYRYPLYKRPADLVSDPFTGTVKGRNVNGQIRPYPTRSQIEATSMLQGQELVWMKDKLDCYIVQVQGSAKLIMTDGSEMLIGYAGNNGHDYTSVNKLLVADGKLSANTISLPAMRAYFLQNPGELDGYINQNDRFVFFKQYDQTAWPAGSLGVEVTPMRSLATDKSVFPRGLPLLVTTLIPDRQTTGNETRPFEQFMLDQDTGGAIRAPGRADIYMGTGAQAEHIAGRQLHEGRLYYLILKPQRVTAWLPHTTPAAAPAAAPQTTNPANMPPATSGY